MAAEIVNALQTLLAAATLSTPNWRSILEAKSQPAAPQW